MPSITYEECEAEMRRRLNRTYLTADGARDIGKFSGPESTHWHEQQLVSASTRMAQIEIDQAKANSKTMKEIVFTIALSAHEGPLQEPIAGKDPEEWPTIDYIQFYRASLKDQSDGRLFLEGPHKINREAFDALLERVFIEAKIQALKQFYDLEKPHERFDAWKSRQLTQMSQPTELEREYEGRNPKLTQ